MKKLILASIILYLFAIIVSCGPRVKLTDNNTDPNNPTGSTYSLKIKTIDAISNNAVPNIKITLQKDSKPVLTEQMTDSNGETIFKNVPGADGYKAFAYPTRGYKPTTSSSIKLSGNIEVAIPLYTITGDGSGIVAGSVKDITTQQALSNVSVLLSGKAGVKSSSYSSSKVTNKTVKTYAAGSVVNIPTVTDAGGQFTIENIPTGTYSISFTKTAYKKIITSNVSVTEGNITSIETVFMKKEQADGDGHVLAALGNGQLCEFDEARNLISSKPLGYNLVGATRLSNGNTVVADLKTAGVIEMDPNGKVLWNTASLFNPFKLPAWVSPASASTAFVTDINASKVCEVSAGKVIWTLPLKLNGPACAVDAGNGNLLVSDTGNSRVIEVTKTGNIVWTFNTQISKPIQIQPLSNGNVLITDSGYCRVVEVTRKGTPVWYYTGKSTTEGSETSGLLYPRSAIRLANGNTLIADTGNNRIIEVSLQKEIVLEIPNLTNPGSLELL